ncbi:hypothetical protein KQI76_03790 [Amphibacillus sp. MSJ-3]|uniref:hypothetical protein n=1 Tax=Amphibacillus sp. MSJ-3 TaxID=2841505 RepID=UPI001C0EF10E|nr:hypothetical protein [Amphibacillus sp. MSJ-3]MBU5594277.1 hypothetical protein [Amphibacillus sp. MSJ-3]
MIKLKLAIIEIIKLVIIFMTTILIVSYGLSLMQNEYQQRLRELEPEKAAEQVNLFNFFLE